MNYKEAFMTTICNILPFLKRFTKKRWYKLPKSVWVIFDDSDNIYSNKGKL